MEIHSLLSMLVAMTTTGKCARQSSARRFSSQVQGKAFLAFQLDELGNVAHLSVNMEKFSEVSVHQIFGKKSVNFHRLESGL